LTCESALAIFIAGPADWRDGMIGAGANTAAVFFLLFTGTHPFNAEA
jgi:hypothetical protein